MIRKFFKYLKVTPIDVRIYVMTADNIATLTAPGFEIQTDIQSGKKRYFITDHGKFVHASFIFDKLNLLSILGKDGPAIGDCVTSADYRGRSIYPTVINLAAKDLLASGTPEVFIVVNSGNVSSIRGIEKAGFRPFADVKAKRFLLFYFDKTIKRY
jgi:RimJ/RimL family protein N-acetyltransferase